MAFQIKDNIDVLGASIGVKTIALVGGFDIVKQAFQLSNKVKPHIIVCTPGRLYDHLENTKGFNLKYLKYLVTFFFIII